jgi:hypothetical protein
MKTLGLVEAATFLNMHPEELRRRAKIGAIPGAKIGRAWVFIEEDLAVCLRSLYSQPWQALVGDRSNLCLSTNAVAHGGLGSPHRAANLLDSLLKPKTSKLPKNSTIS